MVWCGEGEAGITALHCQLLTSVCQGDLSGDSQRGVGDGVEEP